VQSISKRNISAHETTAAFADLLTIPEFVYKHEYWKYAFVFVTGKSLEEMVEVYEAEVSARLCSL
jgi:hypothetical protein